MYTPNPQNTDNIVLPDDILVLKEILAENTHEIWAAERIAEGWTYGEFRDDGKKTHPGLVPYSELSESEKQYDRNTSMETLKVILSLGYKIVKLLESKHGKSR